MFVGKILNGTRAFGLVGSKNFPNLIRSLILRSSISEMLLGVDL